MLFRPVAMILLPIVLANCGSTPAPDTRGELVTGPLLPQMEVTRDGRCFARADPAPGLEPRETGDRFETLCPPDLTQEFVANLQRALAARGAYFGAINGNYDPATRSAVRRFQRAGGLDSDQLSRQAAQSLGLISIGRTS